MKESNDKDNEMAKKMAEVLADAVRKSSDEIRQVKREFQEEDFWREFNNTPENIAKKEKERERENKSQLIALLNRMSDKELQDLLCNSEIDISEKELAKSIIEERSEERITTIAKFVGVSVLIIWILL